MLFDLLLDALVTFFVTVVVLAALVISCASLYPPRSPRGPRR